MAVVQDPLVADEAALARSEVVLLVEDEASVRRLVRRTLTQAGYHVLEADTPEDAVHICRSHDGPIDLVLTDVVMPQISGPDLVARLQQVRPGTLALFMSGYASDQHRRFSEESTASWLQKPFTPAMLTRKVREVLDAAADHKGTNRPTATEPPPS